MIVDEILGKHDDSIMILKITTNTLRSGFVEGYYISDDGTNFHKYPINKKPRIDILLHYNNINSHVWVMYADMHADDEIVCMQDIAEITDEFPIGTWTTKYPLEKCDIVSVLIFDKTTTMIKPVNNNNKNV